MPYEMTVTEKDGYLHVRVTGQNSPETIQEYLADVYEACAERQCHTVLIEEDLTGPRLSVIDIFDIITEASNRTWPQVRRIAYVDRQGDGPSSRIKFAETVAVNRGVNVRVFATVEEAAEWLRAS